MGLAGYWMAQPVPSSPSQYPSQTRTRPSQSGPRPRRAPSPRNQYPSQCHAGPQPVPFGSPASAQPVSTRPSQSHQCPDQSHQSRGSDIRPKYCNIRQVVCPANHIESEEQGGGHSLSRGTLERSEGVMLAQLVLGPRSGTAEPVPQPVPARVLVRDWLSLVRDCMHMDGVLVGTGWDWLSPDSPKSVHVPLPYLLACF